MSASYKRINCQIIEMMFAYLRPSIREVERLKITAETMRQKWRRLKYLLSTEYVKKYEKMAQFSVLVGGHDVRKPMAVKVEIKLLKSC